MKNESKIIRIYKIFLLIFTLIYSFTLLNMDKVNSLIMKIIIIIIFIILFIASLIILIIINFNESIVTKEKKKSLILKVTFLSILLMEGIWVLRNGYTKGGLLFLRISIILFYLAMLLNFILLIKLIIDKRRKQSNTNSHK